jgi:hypothetical protein
MYRSCDVQGIIGLICDTSVSNALGRVTRSDAERNGNLTVC